MEVLIHGWVVDLPLLGLFAVIAVALFILAKGADVLVEEAVTLSVHWGVPKVLIGATVVSLGTTLPEAAVSVVAALSGNPGLALGNAVGSVITDCGLILGIAAMIAPLPIHREVVSRQGWIQVGAGVALVLFTFPWGSPGTALSLGGHFSQGAGILFMFGLVAYLYLSIQWGRKGRDTGPVEAIEARDESNLRTIGMLFMGIALVIGASQVLIPTVEVAAGRLGVPDAVIAATLVALGTSLPELVTAVSAVRKGHGELAIGNVIGADILNVLFVAGLSAAVTTGGLAADPRFFRLLFPAMLVLLITFRISVSGGRTQLGRRFGILMLTIYGSATVLSYFV